MPHSGIRLLGQCRIELRFGRFEGALDRFNRIVEREIGEETQE